MEAAVVTIVARDSTTADARDDEILDVYELLLEYATPHDDRTHALALRIANACRGENHLWQDLALPQRQALTDLMKTYFPALHAKNTRNMRWKKFLYRQLCEREDISPCYRPSCSDCCDYDSCFGPEGA